MNTVSEHKHETKIAMNKLSIPEIPFGRTFILI